MLLGRLVAFTTQPRINVKRRFFAMPNTDRDGAFRRHHVTAGKYAGGAGHHALIDVDRAVSLELDLRQLAQELRIAVLAEREDQAVGLQRLGTAGWLRTTRFINLHDLDRQFVLINMMNAAQPVDLDALVECIVGLERESVVIFLMGLILVGVGSGTANLSRYAAADLAPPALRSTHISWVIFASTAGSVGGPLLVGLAGAGAISLGLTENSGAIGIGLVAFTVAAAVVWTFMRPDPLLVAREMGHSATQQKRNFSQAIQIIWNSPMARLALAALVISQAVMVMVMAMTPLHMKAHDHSLTVVGAVISAHTAGMYAFAPIAGWFSDKFGRIKAIGVGSAILLLATIITALATNAPNALMFPGLYLLGLGWSFGIVAGSALLTESVNSEHRVSVQGAADLATNLASGSGALASGLVFDMSGFHTLSLIGTVAAGFLMLHGFWRYRLAVLG